MKRNKLSANQLKEIYHKATHGSSIADVAHSLGLEDGNAYQALQAIKKYIAWIMDGSIKNRRMLRKSYLIAARWAIEQDNIKVTRPEPVSTPPSPAPSQPVTPTVTHYDKLDLSFGVFKDSIHSFIESEVEKRVGEIKAENERMKKMIDEARVGNFADALKQKWEGQK